MDDISLNIMKARGGGDRGVQLTLLPFGYGLERTHRVETHEFDPLSLSFGLSLIHFLKNECDLSRI